MKSTHFKWLEKLFAAEIENRLPFQTRSKVMRLLRSFDWIEHMDITLPGRFPVKIQGWRLTLRGHIAFCEECSRRHPEEKP